MKKTYKHLTLEERELIAVLKAEGQSGRGVARQLGRPPSTINRELCRNKPENGRYLPAKAHRKSKERKQQAGKREKLKNADIRRKVHHLLVLEWSPEIISGWLKLKHPECVISHEAIYQYIYSEAPQLIPCLARRHRKRRKKNSKRKAKKSNIPNRISILDRPAWINDRSEFGHWESDAIVSKQNTFSFNVIVERKSRYSKITPLKNNSSHLTQRAIKLRLTNLPQHAIRTITYDNGSENVQHEKINAFLETKSYFCQPYHSWEKGTVENINGLIRRHLPKKSNLAKVKEWQIAKLEFWLNHRPKKCLGFRTPAEAFYEFSGGVIPP